MPQVKSTPGPPAIPAVPTRPLGLYPRILNGHTLPHALLLHGHPEQLAFVLAAGQAIGADEAQLLAGLLHLVVLPLQIALFGDAEVALVELPGAMDGPVAEGTHAGETEGTGGGWLHQEVAYESCGTLVRGKKRQEARHTYSFILLGAAFVAFEEGGCGGECGGGESREDGGLPLRLRTRPSGQERWGL
jgi:hypothetical protein